MRRAAAVLLAAALLAGCGIEERGPAAPGDTRAATVVDADGNGTLERGPGEALVDRTELAPKGTLTREVVRFGQLTDVHIRDEESPARVPFLDRLGPPFTSTFRPHEALSAQVLTAAIRSLNAARPQSVFLTGDLVDNAQDNEVDLLLGILEGREVDPDSGRPGYRGPQQAGNPDGAFYRPGVDAPRLSDLLTRANTPFLSPGLRARWLPATGNHDVLVQGELPPSEGTDAIATGNEQLQTFDEALRDLVERFDLERLGDGEASPDLAGVPREAIDALLSRGVPGDPATVAPDATRRGVGNAELLARLRRAAGLAPGGGRLAYTATLAEGVRAVVLDTVDRAGGSGGVLDSGQARFLRRELDRAAGDEAIVVVSHHGLHRVDGPGAQSARDAVGASRSVIAELAGDTHRNEIEPVRTRSGGYWRISTGSLSDWPQQGRMLRLVTGANGDRALETWMVDQAGGPGDGDLPGAARRLAWLDAQGGRPQRFAGDRTDRNVRLWLPTTA